LILLVVSGGGASLHPTMASPPRIHCGAVGPLVSIWASNAEDDRPDEDARAIESLMTEELTEKSSPGPPR
jgi:hypothetical protein